MVAEEKSGGGGEKNCDRKFNRKRKSEHRPPKKNLILYL